MTKKKDGSKQKNICKNSCLVSEENTLVYLHYFRLEFFHYISACNLQKTALAQALKFTS